MHFSWQCQTRALKRCCQLSSYACGNSVAAALRVCQYGARNLPMRTVAYTAAPQRPFRQAVQSSHDGFSIAMQFFSASSTSSQGLELNCMCRG